MEKQYNKPGSRMFYLTYFWEFYRNLFQQKHFS